MESRGALDLIFSDHFSPNERSVVAPLGDMLLTHGDYMYLADLTSCLDADQRLCQAFATPDVWHRLAILNVAASGRLSSDRTIAEYASEIWDVKPCPIR